MLTAAAEMSRPPADSGEPMWTVEEACDYFAAAGLPIRPDRLRKIIQGLEWEPAGTRAREPGETGRGKAVYRSSDMMILHARLAEFVATRGIRRRPQP